MTDWNLTLTHDFEAWCFGGVFFSNAFNQGWVVINLIIFIFIIAVYTCMLIKEVDHFGLYG